MSVNSDFDLGQTVLVDGQAMPQTQAKHDKQLWEPREKARIQSAPRPSISVLQDHSFGSMRPPSAPRAVDALVAASPPAVDTASPMPNTTVAIMAEAQSRAEGLLAYISRAIQAVESSESATVAAHAHAGALEAELKAAAAKAEAREKALTASLRASAREREAALQAELQAEREARAALETELADARAKVAAAEAGAAAGFGCADASRSTKVQGSQDDIETAAGKLENTDRCEFLEAENQQLRLQLKRLAGRHKADEARLRTAGRYIFACRTSSGQKRRRLSRSKVDAAGYEAEHMEDVNVSERPSLELVSWAGAVSPDAASSAISPVPNAAVASPAASSAPAPGASSAPAPGAAPDALATASSPGAAFVVAAGSTSSLEGKAVVTPRRSAAQDALASPRVASSASPRLEVAALRAEARSSANSASATTPSPRTSPTRTPPASNAVQDVPEAPRRQKTALGRNLSTAALKEVPGMKILNMQRLVPSAVGAAEPSNEQKMPPPPPPHAVPREVRAGGRIAAPAAPQKGQVLCRCVVRGKEARLGLKAFDCDQCQAFYKATGVAVSSKPPVRAASRHRFEHAPTSTPPGFWDLSFPHPGISTPK